MQERAKKKRAKHLQLTENEEEQIRENVNRWGKRNERSLR